MPRISAKQLSVGCGYLLALYLLPALLTGFTGDAAARPYSLRSYGFGLQLLVGLGLLFPIGALVVQLLSRSSDERPPPIFSICVGLVASVAYVYARSLLNTWFGLPISRVELMAIALGAAGYYLRKQPPDPERLWQSAGVPALLLLPLLVALAQHELPRDIMLSSDPDQHAFFGTQVVNLGGIPFSQGDWGELSFGYPAGTAALILIVSALSVLPVTDATMIFPMLQAYLAVFLLAELALHGRTGRVQLFTFAVVALVFNYWLTYGLEPAHYHLEGYGRLSSLWLTALAIHVLLHDGHFSTANSWALLGLIGLTLFVAAAINPVNVFLLASIMGVGFLARFPRRFWQLPGLALLIPLLCLDPYYYELVTGFSRDGGGALIVNPVAVPVDLSTVLSVTVERLPFWLGQDERFLGFVYTPQSFTLVFSLLLGGLLLVGETRKALKALGLLALVFATWALLSPTFEHLGPDARYRLLFPYLQYSRMQVMYCVLVFCMALLSSRLLMLSQGWESPTVVVALVGYGLASWQPSAPTIDRRARQGYCGSMGCLTRDDRKLVAAIVEIKESLPSEQPYPRVLVPNAIATHGPETWLMPKGGSRSLVYFETLPLAFYYYQGDPDYTLENYRERVCESFDVDWLRSHRIQYLFDPSNKMDTCIHERAALKRKFAVVSQSGAAVLYRLYD